MSQNLINSQAGFPSLFHIANSHQTLTLPFTRTISLLECHIAGTNFRPDVAAAEPHLTPGTKLILRREPNNEHDPSAIAVYCQNYHLGYIPKTKNEVLANLLDAGKSIAAVLKGKEFQESWLKLDIEVFLND